jgi:PIN domain nuclease of toxin-antitoxin system
VRVLLDTHLIIWALSEPDKLSNEAKDLINNAEQIFVSSASIWEMAIKSSLGKLEADLKAITAELNRLGVLELAISWQHSQQVKLLPHHHRDPFDRLIVSQAICEPLILLTHDKILSKYSDLVKLV